jgi:lipopolysaccharide/colanic/teichoic acid biosynthesis glycosyltransferase
LIRRLSVDEMPQLINVLRGEMSLVGPRPEMPFIVARYHPVECERLIVRPGITGLWQISPARAFPIHENLQYDLHYIRNQNLVLDCAIVLRTVAAVIRGVGAI